MSVFWHVQPGTDHRRVWIGVDIEDFRLSEKIRCIARKIAQMIPTPSKMELGDGVTPGIPFVVPFSLSWGRLNKWNQGPPPPFPLR